MGSAIVRNLESQGIWNVVECEIDDDPNEKLKDCDVAIIAVKPQYFFDLAKSIDSDVSYKLFISIMAGVNIHHIQESLKAEKVVRTMPNLAVQVGKGVVGWCGSEVVGDDEKNIIRNILSTMGESIELKDEEKLDAITALSGSGPAYFFYLTELLQKKAEEFGFSFEQAKKIAEMTFAGSAELLEKNEKSAEEWRVAVTSPGGTTEAALKHLEENKFDQIFKDGIEVARKRAEELS